MLRECTYGECAHEQHVRRTLTITLTLTHTINAYSVSGNVVRVRILICATVQLNKSRVEKEFIESVITCSSSTIRKSSSKNKWTDPGTVLEARIIEDDIDDARIRLLRRTVIITYYQRQLQTQSASLTLSASSSSSSSPVSQTFAGNPRLRV